METQEPPTLAEPRFAAYVHKQWHHGGYKTLYIVKDMQGSPKQIARGANKEVAERIAYLLNTYGK
jgi:hypothetical protein